MISWRFDRAPPLASINMHTVLGASSILGFGGLKSECAESESTPEISA